MKELLRCLKPLKNRIHFKYLITVVLSCITAAFCIDALIMLYSKFRYVYGVLNIASVIPVLILAVGLIIWQFMRPTDYRTAKTADGLGFKERFVTAYEVFNKKEPSQMEMLAADDAIRCARSADFKKIYRIKPNKKLLIAPCAAFALFIAILLLPVEPSAEMQEQQELHEMLDKTVEKMQNEVEASNLTKKQKKEISKELKGLKKELSKAQNKQQAANTVMQGQTKLKKNVENSENEQLKAIGTKLAENESTQNLGELLKNGNEEEFTEALNELNNSLSDLSEDEIKEFGRAFKDAAQSSELDNDTKQLLNELGETMQNELTDEQLSEVSQNLGELSDKVNELAKQNSDVREAVEMLNDELADAGEELSGSGKEGMTAAKGEASGDVSDSSASDSHGTEPGKGSIPNANIYTSSAKGYADYDAELNQNGNGEKNGETVKNKVDGEYGEVLPYTDVYDVYKQEAMNGIDREDIPYGVKDIVKDYFSSLE